MLAANITLGKQLIKFAHLILVLGKINKVGNYDN